MRREVTGITIMSSFDPENRTSFSKKAKNAASTTPLLPDDAGVSPPTSSTPEEMNHISWGRAIGVFNLYVVWLILDLIGL